MYKLVNRAQHHSLTVPTGCERSMHVKNLCPAEPKAAEVFQDKKWQNDTICSSQQVYAQICADKRDKV